MLPKAKNNHNWKSYVDWWPTYLILGISLAHFVEKTEIITQLINKLFTKKEAE